MVMSKDVAEFSKEFALVRERFQSKMMMEEQGWGASLLFNKSQKWKARCMTVRTPSAKAQRSLQDLLFCSAHPDELQRRLDKQRQRFTILETRLRTTHTDLCSHIDGKRNVIEEDAAARIKKLVTKETKSYSRHINGTMSRLARENALMQRRITYLRHTILPTLEKDTEELRTACADVSRTIRDLKTESKDNTWARKRV